MSRRIGRTIRRVVASAFLLALGTQRAGAVSATPKPAGKSASTSKPERAWAEPDRLPKLSNEPLKLPIHDPAYKDKYRWTPPKDVPKDEGSDEKDDDDEE